MQQACVTRYKRRRQAETFLHLKAECAAYALLPGWAAARACTRAPRCAGTS